MGYTFAPVNDRNGLIAMCVIFSITSTAVVVLRFYARKFKGLRLLADDWLIAISLVFKKSWAKTVDAVDHVIVAGVCYRVERNVPCWYALAYIRLRDDI